MATATIPHDRRSARVAIVEQHVGHAFALCERVVLLHHGAVSWSGPSKDAVDRVVTEVFDHGVAH